MIDRELSVKMYKKDYRWWNDRLTNSGQLLICLSWDVEPYGNTDTQAQKQTMGVKKNVHAIHGLWLNDEWKRAKKKKVLKDQVNKKCFFFYFVKTKETGEQSHVSTLKSFFFTHWYGNDRENNTVMYRRHWMASETIPPWDDGID